MTTSFKRVWSNYSILALVSASVTAALSITLVFVPGLIHWLFQINNDPGTIVMSRRAGMLFLGLCLILFMSRNEPPSNLRQAVTLAIALTMFGLVCVGLYEYLKGTVGGGIWLAILTEAFFVAAFLRHSKIPAG